MLVTFPSFYKGNEEHDVKARPSQLYNGVRPTFHPKNPVKVIPLILCFTDGPVRLIVTKETMQFTVYTVFHLRGTISLQYFIERQKS